MITMGESVFIGTITFIFGVFFGYSIGFWNKFTNCETSEVKNGS